MFNNTLISIMQFMKAMFFYFFRYGIPTNAIFTNFSIFIRNFMSFKPVSTNARREYNNYYNSRFLLEFPLKKNGIKGFHSG